mmetsp:Transcript_43469/g.102266  ORF Transcript_43469/g.102266 Transcript_43469/m.102266 type:complete len:256 (+) Transcript_43469:851-1618(+)
MNGWSCCSCNKTIQSIHKSLSGGHHHIRMRGMTGIELAVSTQTNGDITHGINAFRHRLHRKLHQFIGLSCQLVEGTTNSIHRSGANRGCCLLLAILIGECHSRCGLKTAAAAHLHQLELVLGIGLLHLNTDDRFEIAVRNFPLAISKILEASKGIIKVLTAEVIAELFEPSPNSASAAELAQRDPIVGEPNGARINDFVGEPVFQHSVLMDARFMRERIGTHNRLIGLHHHAGEIGDQARGLRDFLRTDCSERGW